MGIFKKLFSGNGKGLAFATFTDTGSRPVNEDAVISAKKSSRQCFVLCDGLGGHGMGDMASQFVTSYISEKFLADNAPVSAEFCNSVIPEAEKKLVGLQTEKGATGKMRTTCVLLLTDKSSSTAYISHVGDSRLYAFDKAGNIIFRTTDHSVPEMLRLSGQIEEKDIRHHPDRNKILRCMGTGWDSPMNETEKTVSLDNVGAFLLCSDGFWELCEDADMVKCLKAATDGGGKNAALKWIAAMSDIVKENGKGKNMDNFSAIAVLNI